MAESVNGITSADNTQFTAKRNTGGLGKDDFLRLLTTQLEHQDPLNPASEQEMVGTLAQFSSLEQTQKLADSMAELTKTTQWGQGGSLLGRYVQGRTEAGDAVQGIVEGLRMSEDKLILHLNTNKELPLTGLSEVLA
jgi:flagellar basal-body rod modification protein FlgD